MLDKGETPRWRMLLDARLSEVNKPQKFDAPDKVAKGLPKDGLGGREAKAEAATFTIGALYLDPPAGLAQTTAGVLRFGALERNARTSQAVERAIRANKRVVLFFHQSRGVDDPVIAASVARVRADRSAVVFADNVDNLAAYGRAISEVGVTRAPSVVIIGKSGKARLIEGYIDPAALAQEVADTR
jgi:hypothetical protein